MVRVYINTDSLLVCFTSTSCRHHALLRLNYHNECAVVEKKKKRITKKKNWK